MTVEEYLENTPEPARSSLKHVRAVIRAVVPKETTEVISYGMPMFKFNGMLVGYAAFKKHCSLFPTGSGVLDRFEKELKGYRTSKGTIQFPLDRPLPDALVKKIVRARVKENREWDSGVRCYTVSGGFSHPFAKCAKGWGTRGCGCGGEQQVPRRAFSPVRNDKISTMTRLE